MTRRSRRALKNLLILQPLPKENHRLCHWLRQSLPEPLSGDIPRCYATLRFYADEFAHHIHLQLVSAFIDTLTDAAFVQKEQSAILAELHWEESLENQLPRVLAGTSEALAATASLALGRQDTSILWESFQHSVRRIYTTAVERYARAYIAAFIETFPEMINHEQFYARQMQTCLTDAIRQFGISLPDYPQPLFTDALRSLTQELEDKLTVRMHSCFRDTLLRLYAEDAAKLPPDAQNGEHRKILLCNCIDPADAQAEADACQTCTPAMLLHAQGKQTSFDECFTAACTLLHTHTYSLKYGLELLFARVQTQLECIPADAFSVGTPARLGERIDAALAVYAPQVRRELHLAARGEEALLLAAAALAASILGYDGTQPVTERPSTSCAHSAPANAANTAWESGSSTTPPILRMPTFLPAMRFWPTARRDTPSLSFAA